MRFAFVVMAAVASVGLTVATFWKKEKQWYAGTITEEHGKKHRIEYRDGDVELIDLAKVEWQVDSTPYRLVDPTAASVTDVVEPSFDNSRVLVTCLHCGLDCFSSSFGGERGRRKQYVRQCVRTFQTQHGLGKCKEDAISVGGSDGGSDGATLNVKYVSAASAGTDDVIFDRVDGVVKLACLHCKR